MDRMPDDPLHDYVSRGFGSTTDYLALEKKDAPMFSTATKAADKAFKNYQKAKEVMPVGFIFTDTLTPVLKDLAQLYFSKGDRKQTIAVSNEIRRLILEVHEEMNTRQRSLFESGQLTLTVPDAGSLISSVLPEESSYFTRRPTIPLEYTTNR